MTMMRYGSLSLSPAWNPSTIVTLHLTVVVVLLGYAVAVGTTFELQSSRTVLLKRCIAVDIEFVENKQWYCGTSGLSNFGSERSRPKGCITMATVMKCTGKSLDGRAMVVSKWTVVAFFRLLEEYFQYITAIKQEVLDHLRQIRHAPSVQMQEVPPDLLDRDEVSFAIDFHFSFLGSIKY